ncbi:MAG: transposase [Spirulina sp.]
MPSIIGVEVAKTSVLCCNLDDGLPVPSDPAQFAHSYEPIPILANSDGVKRLLELGDHYVIEPTGDYSRVWINTLRANGKTVLRVNPKRVSALKQYHGVASKTDRYDAAFLAIYGAMNHGKPSAFLSDYAEELREATAQHQFLSRQTGNLQRRLWQLLSHEWPEACRVASGKKPQQRRLWLSPHPPALWRFVAGESVRNQKSREASLDETIGSGLSVMSKTLAAQVCEMERQQFLIEEHIAAILEVSEFKPYHTVFDRFGFGEMTRAVLLSRIYPFDRFLGPDGKPRREKRPSSKTEGRFHRRDRSLGAFRMALGNGTRVYQSGQDMKRRAAGSQLTRTALYLHVGTKICMASARNLAMPPKLRAHADYHQSLAGVPHKQAVSKTMSRIVKDLYRELLATL